MRDRRGVHGALAVAALITLGACSTAEMPPAPPAPATAKVAGQCPEPRDTEVAPEIYQFRRNPRPVTPEHLERGRLLHPQETRPVACAACHGVDGDGRGPLGRGLVPPPRNFRCAETMSQLSDGQLFWVIENGSGPYHFPAEQRAQRIERPARSRPFTGMRPYRDTLEEIDIWELVMYIRTLAPR
jgi:hypothetical protein